MDNISTTNSVAFDNNLATKSIKIFIANTHCTICGKAFVSPRKGKLYCSPRCRQFGFNHKESISKVLTGHGTTDAALPTSFYLEDYAEYSETQKHLKRYRELQKKKQAWEATEQEIALKQLHGLIPSEYLWGQLTSRKLTDTEDMELYELEAREQDDILQIILKPLSIEQWSFLRLLYPNLVNSAFYSLIAHSLAQAW